MRQLTQATILANRRGSKAISIVDLIFQIRHDRAKVSRLKTFLSWKDVRKNVKDSDDKGGGDAGDVGDFEEVRTCAAEPTLGAYHSPLRRHLEVSTHLRRKKVQQTRKPSFLFRGKYSHITQSRFPRETTKKTRRKRNRMKRPLRAWRLLTSVPKT